jgi:hypothetical protein
VAVEVQDGFVSLSLLFTPSASTSSIYWSIFLDYPIYNSLQIRIMGP